MDMLPCCVDKHLCESDILEDIKNKPYEVFVNDLMFFLCQECKVFWVPPCHRTYEIHPKSPLKVDMRSYIRNSFRKTYAKLELLNHYRGSKAFKSDLEMFDTYTRELRTRLKFASRFVNEQDAQKIFLEVVNIAVCCIVLYEQGMQDAISFGVTGMTEAIEEYLSKTGYSFDSISERISCLIRNLPVVENWPSDMIDKLHDVFACDLLVFLCKLSNIVWLPPNCETYTIHPKSPLTEHIRQFIIKLPIDSSVTYYRLLKIYRKEEGVFEAFSESIIRILGDISSARIPEDKSADMVFLLVLKTMSLGVELHKRGMLGILSTILRQLSKALYKCNRKNNGRIFDLFVTLARYYLAGRSMSF